MKFVPTDAVGWFCGVKHGNIQLLGTLAYSAPLISVVLLIATGFGERLI